ncbi:PQQ-like beta-propeller repeat protein [Rhodococcus hoagii]|nr:PQQ-like beta-propeller repeat protein [Prescottella equi]
MPPPRRRRGPILVAVAAAALVVALVAGGTYWVLTRDGDTPEPVAKGMLRYTFPTQPTRSWSISPTDVGGVPGDAFFTPVSGSVQYYGAGFVDVGDTLVTMRGPVRARSGMSSGGDTAMIGLDSESGAVRWTRPMSAQSSCDDAPVDGVLPCVIRGEPGENARVEFVDLRSGATRNVFAPDFSVIDTTSDGSTVFVAGYDAARRSSGGGFVLTSGSATDPSSAWQAWPTLPESCTWGGGDRHSFEFRQGRLFYKASQNAYAFDAATGTLLGAGSFWDFTGLGADRFAGSVCNSTPDEAVVAALDSAGSVVFEQSGRLRGPHQTFTTLANVPVFIDDSVYMPGDGSRLWTARRDLDTASIVGDRVLALKGTTVTALALDDGEELWSITTTPSSGRSFETTDGRVVVTRSEGSLDAYDLRDGSLAWTLPGDVDLIGAGGNNLVAATGDSLTAYAPTGGPATVPGAIGTVADSTSGGSGDLVTKCGSRPELEPVSFRTDAGGLIVEMRVRATCPGGDILSTDAMRVTVRDNGSPVASSTFDFSATPLTLPPTNGGGTDYATARLRYPLGSFWRLPGTLGDGRGGVSGSGGGDILVDCEDEGTSSGPTTASAPSGTSSPLTFEASTTAAVGVDAERASRDALREQADADAPFVRSDLADRWVPLLSSKQPGLVADGLTWNNAEILREHLDLRLRYPEVRLMWSGDWSTFTERDWWVTAAGVTFPTPEGANAWCDSKGFATEHCFAKLVSTTHGVDGSTRYRK